MGAAPTRTNGYPWEKYQPPASQRTAGSDFARAESPISDERQITASCPLCRGAGFLRRPLGAPGQTELARCACKEGESRARIWAKARKQSGLPDAAIDLDFASFASERQPVAYDAAREFAEHPNRQWLILRGEPGTGKSHLLVAVANALLPARQPLYFVVPDLLDYLRAGMEERDEDGETTIARTRTVCTCDVLILDDLGAENSTKWTDERLYQIIDHRYRYNLPLALATNLSPDKLPPRIASRFADISRARLIQMRAGDYRRSDERADELAALLADLDALPKLSAAAD